jgi:hypothetical protein
LGDRDGADKRYPWLLAGLLVIFFPLDTFPGLEKDNFDATGSIDSDNLTHPDIVFSWIWGCNAENVEPLSAPQHVDETITMTKQDHLRPKFRIRSCGPTKLAPARPMRVARMISHMEIIVGCQVLRTAGSSFRMAWCFGRLAGCRLWDY